VALAASSFAAPAAAAPTAHDIAVRISSWGPRPAAGPGEARAHRLMARTFRSAGLRVAVQEFGVPGRGRSRNVIGVIDTPATCLRIAMAHTDSAPPAPGANDNASGLGVLAAVASHVRSLEPGCDVWLVATGAEERVYTWAADHLGALALARRARARGGQRRLQWALSLDEVGRDRPFWLRSPVPAVRSGVEGALLRAARGAHVPVSWMRDDDTGNSDHREFELLGLPGMKLGVGAGGEPCRHTACDRPERLDPTSLRLARRLLEAALTAPRGSGPAPTG
jgi:aminopeptidase YwaD